MDSSIHDISLLASCLDLTLLGKARQEVVFSHGTLIDLSTDDALRIQLGSALFDCEMEDDTTGTLVLGEWRLQVIDRTSDTLLAVAPARRAAGASFATVVVTRVKSGTVVALFATRPDELADVLSTFAAMR